MRPAAVVVLSLLAVPAMPRVAFAEEPSPPSPPATTAPRPEPPAPPTDVALVQLRMLEPGTLLQRFEWRRAGHAYWEGSLDICTAPCDARVPRDATYRVLGADFPPSGRFTPPSKGSEYLVQVHRGSKGRQDCGGVLTVLGALGAAAGTVTFIAGQGSSNDLTGAVLLGIGVVGLAVGLPLLLTSATTVEFE